jgi:hypothetical protein
VLEWVKLADFYQFPHIFQFSSFSDLCSQLAQATPETLKAVSRKMVAFSKQQQRATTNAWEQIVKGIVAQRKPAPSSLSSSSSSSSSSAAASASSKVLPRDINEALAAAYGYTLPGKCLGQSPSH